MEMEDKNDPHKVQAHTTILHVARIWRENVEAPSPAKILM